MQNGSYRKDEFMVSSMVIHCIVVFHSQHQPFLTMIYYDHDMIIDISNSLIMNENPWQVKLE